VRIKNEEIIYFLMSFALVNIAIAGSPKPSHDETSFISKAKGWEFLTIQGTKKLSYTVYIKKDSITRTQKNRYNA